MNKKDFLVYFFIIILILGILYMGINRISYFDAQNFCYISISNDILRGNRNTIIDALHMIKKQNSIEYQRVCKYINRISEGFCIAADWHLDPKWMTNAEGKNCYIQGSNTIYLYPQEQDSMQIVKQRAVDIIELSKLSENFWSSK